MRYRILIILCLFYVETQACSCVGEHTVKEQIKKSSLVFSGQLISKTVINIRDTIDNLGSDSHPVWDILEKPMLIYQFKIESMYKGRIKLDTISILTGIPNMCGLQFEIGRRYIVYAELQNRHFQKGTKVKEFFYSDSCSRSCEKNDDEIKAIEKIRHPKKRHKR